jgi:hypothetical protein
MSVSGVTCMRQLTHTILDYLYYTYIGCSGQQLSLARHAFFLVVQTHAATRHDEQLCGAEVTDRQTESNTLILTTKTTTNATKKIAWWQWQCRYCTEQQREKEISLTFPLGGQNSIRQLLAPPLLAHRNILQIFI